MRWILALTLIPLGSCLIGVGDVESEKHASGGSAGTTNAGSGGVSATGGGIGDSSLGGTGGVAGGPAGGTGGTSSGGSGGTAGAAGAAGAACNLVFSDHFEADLAQWVAKGDGLWSIDELRVHQSVQSATTATLYANGVIVADVRATVKAAQVTGSDIGAVEMSMHYNVAADEFYHCNWAPNAHSLIIKSYVTTGKVLIQKLVLTPATYDPKAPIHLEMTAIGPELRCRVLELPDADLTVTTSEGLTGGTVALRTWNMEAYFDDFELCAL